MNEPGSAVAKLVAENYRLRKTNGNLESAYNKSERRLRSLKEETVTRLALIRSTYSMNHPIMVALAELERDIRLEGNSVRDRT